MTNVTQRTLPHAIAYSDIGDPVLRMKVMCLVENIKSLSAQLAEAQRAITELQRR